MAMVKHTLVSIAILAAVSLGLGGPVLPHGSEQVAPRDRLEPDFAGYAFVYYRGEQRSDGEQVYIAVSSGNDPRSWTTLGGGRSVLTSDVGTGGARDPALVVAPDRSKFYIIATDLKVNGVGWDNGGEFTKNGSKSIVVWESTDLSHWSRPALRRVSPPDAGMTWAPDAIWDPEKGQFMVYWTSKIGDATRQLRTWTPDFQTFSSTETFVDLGSDNTIVRDDSSNRYYMFSKNGPDNLIQQNVADQPAGPWSKVSERIGQDTVPAGEGPLAFRDNLDHRKWHLWIDDTSYASDGTYVPFETTDIAGGKWTSSKDFKLPANPRHGSVVPITAAERDALLAIQT